MADTVSEPLVEFATHPDRYRHWTLTVDGPVATLALAVDPAGGLRDDYELKMNSYDLGVDIELYDAGAAPALRAPRREGGRGDRRASTGCSARGRTSACSPVHRTTATRSTSASSPTRRGTRDRGRQRPQRPGVDRRRQRHVPRAAATSSRSPATRSCSSTTGRRRCRCPRCRCSPCSRAPVASPGVVDKRRVRRDLADAFATRTEGVRGQTAVDWGLVDDIAPPVGFDDLVAERAAARAAASDRPAEAVGVELTPLDPDGRRGRDHLPLRAASRSIGRIAPRRSTVAAPGEPQPIPNGDRVASAAGASGWLLATARALDDAFLHLRFNEPEIGTWVLSRRRAAVTPSPQAEDVLTGGSPTTGSSREVRLYWARVLKRLDLSARSIVASSSPGAATVGVLAELLLAADRSYMLDGTWEDLDDPPPPATIRLTDANLGAFPMCNGLTRLQSRFWGRDATPLQAADADGRQGPRSRRRGDGTSASSRSRPTTSTGTTRSASRSKSATASRPTPSPGMEANLRFVGPETMETKIFARLTRVAELDLPTTRTPSGPTGALGTGSRLRQPDELPTLRRSRTHE